MIIEEYNYQEKNYCPTKKNCFMILPRPIYPLISGYSNKNYNLIAGLSLKYNISVAVLLSQKFTKEEIEYYKQYACDVIGIILTKNEKGINALKYLFSREPIQVGLYYKKSIKNLLEKKIKHADIAIASLVRTIKYLDDNSYACIKIFDMVDSIGLNYRNSIQETTSIFWKMLYFIEGKRLVRYEQLKVRSSDCTFFINDKEESYYSSYGETAWLPHGVKESLFHYTKKDERFKKSVAFIGKMDYQPNIDAIKWYISSVHSKIGQFVPLIIVGANPTKEVINLQKNYSNIIVTGYCDDPYIYLNSAMALIAPMQTGGGIQNKVLEGMALGKINVISTLAARPIVGSQNKIHYLVADTAEEYCSIIKNIAENPDDYTHIENEAQKFIYANFTWQAYNAAYTNKLETLLYNNQRRKTDGI